MQEQLFKDLSELGIKLSKVERDLEMPQNYLSRFKNLLNPLPTKWFEPLKSYIEGKKSNVEIIENAPIEVKKGADENLKNNESEISNSKTKKVPPISTTPRSLSESCKLQAVIDKINKDFGEGSIMFLGDKPHFKSDVISTGSLGLDLATGIKGLPRGRIVEIFGLESSGKTTICTQVIAEAQKQGLRCAIVDAENSFDPEYAINLGVKIEKLLISQPSCGEEGLDWAEKIINSGEVGVIIIDSVAALVPKAEFEAEMEETKMGAHARLMSKACRKLVGIINKTNTLVIFINQLRNKIGVVFGSPYVTTGGMALSFYSSIRIELIRQAQIKDGDVSVGNKIKAKVVKNKCAPPYKWAEFEIKYGEGINRIGEIVDLASNLNIIQKSGAWYNYNETKIGQGRETACQFLKDNDGVAKEIETKILENLKIN